MPNTRTTTAFGATAQGGDDQPVVCIAENRASCEPALRLLVASLARHSPDCRVRLFAPSATPDFTVWLAGYPQVGLSIEPFAGGWDKYEVKPKALLAVLREGAASAVWIDSDIVVTSDFRGLLRGLAQDEIVVTEEALSALDPGVSENAAPTRGWRLPVGRILPIAPNSGVVRVTPAHVPLLEAWRTLLESAEYRDAQALPWAQRPVHCFGDQEVLAALLCSADYADVPVRMLRRGRDIVQYFGTAGFTVRDRLRSLWRGLPPLVHSQGYRPWWPQTAWEGPGFLRLYYELSPYTVLAQRNAAVLADRGWLRAPSRAARMLRLAGLRSPALTGLPLAAIADMRRLVVAARARLGMLRPAAVSPTARVPAVSRSLSSR